MTAPAHLGHDEGPLRPSKLWYGVGGAIIALGVIGAVAWFVVGIVGIASQVSSFERVDDPGGGTVTLDAGDYVVYVEPDDDRAVFSNQVEILDPDGQPVPTSAYGGSLTYDFDESGSAVATFTAPSDGDYTVLPRSSDRPSPGTIAIGPSIGGRLVTSILGPFVLGGLAILIGLIVIVVTIVRRSRAGQRRRAAGPSGPPGPSSWGDASWGAPPPTDGPPPPAPPPPPSGPSSGWSAPGSRPAAPPRGDPPPPPGWSS